ncbi:hypothetical protein [Aquimarina sp. 2201CG14-23]|uniref:hypothetical protein n=1 Tax=Aquimarina mycalae TaxID=3040073 RepID=UPI002477DC87|nr:hypothetical protein [Aquimarina sp. 2201CG14-23]MDH7448123.1 hypothetical protein [Aquimarina sp. 2201CG14-23]
MNKRLLFVILFISAIITSVKAQTGNQSTGSAITPNQSTTSNTPFPYNGSTTFTPGSSLTTGDWNLSIGPGAGASLGISYRNILIGGLAGALLNESTSGVDAEDNVVIGMFAADLTQSASDNVFIGNYVARNATGNDNVIIGHLAGQDLTTGLDNVVIGEQAGYRLTEGRDNVVIGEDAGYELTTGRDNCFVGSRAGYENRTASGNTFVGGEGDSSLPGTIGNGFDYDFVLNSDGVGQRNRNGVANTFVGSGAGMDNVDGFVNTFVGYAAGANTQHADGNTFIGYAAGWDNNRTNNRNDANRNTYIGVMTGGTNREGSDNIGMGWKADFSGNGVFGPSDNKNQRNIFIGNAVSVFGNDQVIIGHGARSTGNQRSITIGAQSSTASSYAAAIGYDVDVANANTMALGGDQTTNRMSVGIGTVAANQNASLELADTDKGFLVNRLTTAQRIAMETEAASGNPIGAAEAGMIVYDTDLNTLFVWDGSSWTTSTIDTTLLTSLEDRITALETTSQGTGNDKTPQLFNYQSVVRDSNGNILVNTNMSFRISVLQTDPSGASVYTETHNSTTNANGVSNFRIGSGTLVSGDFAIIDWASDSYYLQVEADITGGTAYQVIGSSQLVSVPYALHAKTADALSGAGATSTKNSLEDKTREIEELTKKVEKLEKMVEALLSEK